MVTASTIPQKYVPEVHRRSSGFLGHAHCMQMRRSKEQAGEISRRLTLLIGYFRLGPGLCILSCSRMCCLDLLGVTLPILSPHPRWPPDCAASTPRSTGDVREANSEERRARSARLLRVHTQHLSNPALSALAQDIALCRFSHFMIIQS